MLACPERSQDMATVPKLIRQPLCDKTRDDVSRAAGLASVEPFCGRGALDAFPWIVVHRTREKVTAFVVIDQVVGSRDHAWRHDCPYCPSVVVKPVP